LVYFFSTFGMAITQSNEVGHARVMKKGASVGKNYN
jgi:hypothetical protein